jgi:chaperone modulatory protein CbpM
MMTLDDLLRLNGRIERVELLQWIAWRWVRPEREGGAFRFDEADLARVRLIHEIRHEMGIEPDTVPVVLSLLDQVYDLRRQLRALAESLADSPDEVQREVLERCRRRLARR